MQAIGSRDTAIYSYGNTSPANSIQAEPSQQKNTTVDDATSQNRPTIENSKYDLTNITPKEITELSAKLYEEGTIDIHQMVGLFATSLQYQHPPNSEGMYLEKNANNQPFNLLEHIEQEKGPIKGSNESLLEILSGLQNAYEAGSYEPLDVHA